MDPDPGAKKRAGKGSKSYLLEENLKIMTKNRQKNEKGNKFLLKINIKLMENFQDRCVWIRNRIRS